MAEPCEHHEDCNGLDPFDRNVAKFVHQVRLLLYSNTFWTWLLVSGATLLVYLPQGFLTSHPTLAMWVPALIAQFTLAYKIVRNLQKPGSENIEMPPKK